MDVRCVYGMIVIDSIKVINGDNLAYNQSKCIRIDRCFDIFPRVCESQKGDEIFLLSPIYTFQCTQFSVTRDISSSSVDNILKNQSYDEVLYDGKSGNSACTFL